MAARSFLEVGPKCLGAKTSSAARGAAEGEAEGARFMGEVWTLEEERGDTQEERHNVCTLLLATLIAQLDNLLNMLK